MTNLIRLFLILLTFSLWALPPQEFYFETPKLAIGSDAYYAVEEGRLWRKDKNIDSQWELWGETGLPYDVLKEVPFSRSIIVDQVYADGDIVIATNKTDGRIYIYQTSVSGLVPPAKAYWWDETWGAPFGKPIYMPQNAKGIAVARRSYNTIRYLEDAYGNKVKAGGTGPIAGDGKQTFGGLIHIYVLSEDGTRINYADTGLPPGFAYQFGTPLRGRFIAENIAASGSTVFLIGKTGRIFTRICDFDHNGNNPMMYHYTYEKLELDRTPEENKWTLSLPTPPWHEHAEIPLSGEAVITKKIAMLGTGEGNGERELRVQGTDQAGDFGYYYKKLNEQNWNFKITGEQFSAEDILDTDSERFELGPLTDMHFTGKILLDEKEYQAEILNFNLTQSPANIVVKLGGEHKLQFKLHTVDGWTMQSLENPGHDGSPKLFLGTLELEDDDSLSDVERQFAQQLQRYHLKTFKFYAMATDEYVVIESRELGKKFTMSFKDHDRVITQTPRKYNGYLASVNKPEYIIENINSLPATQYDYISQVIVRNKELLAEVKSKHLEMMKQTGVQLVGCVAIGVVNFLATVTMIRHLVAFENFPGLNKMLNWGPKLIYKRAGILWELTWDIDEAKKIIQKRIRTYSARLKYSNRQMLFDYLKGISSSASGITDGIDLKGYRVSAVAIIDFRPLRDGDEHFFIHINQLRIRVEFRDVLSELESAKKEESSLKNLYHRVIFLPDIAREKLSTNDQQIYDEIFKRDKNYVDSVAGVLFHSGNGGRIYDSKFLQWKRFINLAFR